MKPLTLSVFRSRLGWMGLIAAGNTVHQLTFGHPTAGKALESLDPELLAAAVSNGNRSPLVRRLTAYAAGKNDDFRDIRIDQGPLSDFQRRVLSQCRRIPYGTTTTYADLASKAGVPRAARAVGNCMARNRVPLIIPCHRVVHKTGRPGRYSAPGGASMKRKLLTMESPST